jgi:transposase
MPTYQPYSPEQAELLPAHVKDVLGADRLCFVVHEVVEAYDLSPFEKQEEDAGGQRPYDPRMLLKIWLYGFRVNVRRTRKLEQRIREDLGFRYPAGGATPDHKTLSEFHRRHREAITAMFTEVLLFLRRAGMARHGGDRFNAGEGVSLARPVVAPGSAGAGAAQESAALAAGTGR